MSQPPYPPQGGNESGGEQPAESSGWGQSDASDEPTRQFGQPPVWVHHNAFQQGLEVGDQALRLRHEHTGLEPGARDTALDRLHQAMLMFAAGRSTAVRRFLVDDGVGIERSPWEGIIKTAQKKKCDAIVMASHGRRGLARGVDQQRQGQGVQGRGSVVAARLGSGLDQQIQPDGEGERRCSRCG